jgi:4-amino-4-deoxy-L-arabinose transferase-like glycosyltransferase
MPLNSKFISRLIILGLIWLTLAIRLLYLADTRRDQHPADGLLFAPLCGLDGHIYDQQASDALRGVWPGGQSFDRSPLYPFYLVLNYRLFGLNHYTPLIIQALLQAVLTATLFAVGRLTFSRWAGVGAALGLTFYDAFIFYTGCFAQESLAPVLISLTLFFLLKFQNRPTQPWSAKVWLSLAGVSLGLTSLGRPNLILLLPVIVLWLAWQCPTWLQWVRDSGYVVGGLALIILPITLYNYTVSSQFILISNNGPVNLFIANNPDTEGRDILAPGLAQPVHRRLETVTAAVLRGETTFTGEVLRYIHAQPLDWLALELNKLWLLFGKSDLNILSVSFVYPTTPQQLAIFNTFPLHWAGLVIAAGVGLLFLRPKSVLPLLFLGVITLTTLLFFVQLRFRLLVAPLVLLYAGALPGQAPVLFRENRAKFYLALFILLGTIPFAPAV